MPQPNRLRVLIAGGGVAALEALLALRALAGARVHVTLLAPEREFVVRAATVGEPFDRAPGRRLSLCDIAAEQEAELVRGRLDSVETEARLVHTDEGITLTYDVLVVALGAVPTEPLPGAVTFRGRSDVGEMRFLLEDLDARRIRSVVFALPRTLAWPVPLYELALMTAARVFGHGVTRADLTVVTPEPEPLGVFGPAGSRAMRRLLREHRVALRAGTRPERVEDGALVLADGTRVPANRVVTVPVLEGRRIPGLPGDAHDFIPVDRHGRVRGVGGVYAAGDITNFPLKQGGLAAQQADAVAEAIAARAGALVTPEPFRPIIRGLVMTGAEPLYLRAEPGSASGPGTPLAVVPSAFDESDRPLWWPPAKLAGRYLAPYLATARPTRSAEATLVDRPAAPSR